MIGLDTNVLLRYLLKDDPVQAARAERELERDARFGIDGIVLCELVWVLEAGYGFSRSDIVAALDDFRRSAADFSDCLIGRRNRNTGASETVTFDRSLRGLPGLRLL